VRFVTRNKGLRFLALFAAASMAACSHVGSSIPPQSVAKSGETTLRANVMRGCDGPKRLGYALCEVLVRTDVGGGNPNGYHGLYHGRTALRRGNALAPASGGAPSGYGPSDLQSAYALTAASSSAGAGQTIAVVDAFDDPNAEADLAVYRAQYGLPACTTANGCFRKVNQQGAQSGYPSQDAGWDLEISLDLDMVSAICPNCHVLLVEATTNFNSDLGASVNTAVSLGANVVSNSYAGPESAAYDANYDHPGHIITASSGDNLYAEGVKSPASYGTVVSVGGTSLSRASNARGWTESVWNDVCGSGVPCGTGSGCSAFAAKPAWQTDTGCSKRMENDVAAVADPATGVAVYDSVPLQGASGWEVVGGTSASSPIIAAIYGLGGAAANLTYAQSLYALASSLNDVTSGNNGSCSPAYFCTAGVGYDGPTGNGTPNGITAFQPPPSWHTTGGFAADVGANDSIAWAVPSDGSLWFFNETPGSAWSKTNGASATKVEVSPQGTAYAVLTDQSIWRFNAAGIWERVGCCGVDIGIGPNQDDMWIIGADGLTPFHFVNGSFQQLPGQFTRITVSPEGIAYALSTDKNIWTYSAASNSWTHFACCADDIGVGSNQNVWVIGDGNTVWHWNGTGWNLMPGSGTSIAVTPSGIPWVTQPNTGAVAYYK